MTTRTESSNLLKIGYRPIFINLRKFNHLSTMSLKISFFFLFCFLAAHICISSIGSQSRFHWITGYSQQPFISLGKNCKLWFLCSHFRRDVIFMYFSKKIEFRCLIFQIPAPITCMLLNKETKTSVDITSELLLKWSRSTSGASQTATCEYRPCAVCKSIMQNINVLIS